MGWWKIITCVKEGGRYLPTISCIRHYPPAHLKYTVIDIVNILYSYENKQLLKIKIKVYIKRVVLFTFSLSSEISIGKWSRIIRVQVLTYNVIRCCSRPMKLWLESWK